MDWMIEPLRKAVVEKPRDVYARFELANALASANRHEEALQELDQVLALDADYERGAAWYNRGNSLTALGRLEEAVTSYDQALARSFDDAFAAAQNKALALDALGRREQAEAARAQAAELGAAEGEQLFAAGNQHFSAGRHAEAIALYRDSIARGWPGAHVALLNGAICQHRENNLEAALEWVGESLRRAPEYLPALNHQGLFSLQAGRPAEALAAFDRGLAVRPDATGHYNRACALARLGRTDQAFAALARALELEPGTRDDIAAESDFESLRGDPRFRALVAGGA
jgi:tetratricopeptide (TPR) repeat protein